MTREYVLYRCFAAQQENLNIHNGESRRTSSILNFESMILRCVIPVVLVQ